MKLGAGPQVGLLCSVLKAPEGVSAELERSAVLLLIKCPNSSMVEHTAVNRGVTGSSPVWGALKICLIFFMKMRQMASTSFQTGHKSWQDSCRGLFYSSRRSIGLFEN